MAFTPGRKSSKIESESPFQNLTAWSLLAPAAVTNVTGRVESRDRVNKITDLLKNKEHSHQTAYDAED